MFGKNFSGFVTREEFNESNKRIDAENKRLSHRLDIVEKLDERIYQIIASIEKISLNVEHILKNQEKHEKQIKGHDSRIDSIETKDGKKWNNMMDQIWKLLIAAAVGYFLTKIGIN